jgi:excisionase family DNA binding protein
MELLTLKDASERLGCSTKTLRNRIKSGELRALMKDGKHGPTYFVPEAELLRMQHSEAPGGRSASPAATAAPASTVAPPAVQGSSSLPLEASTVPVAQPAVSSDVILRMVERLEQQATELGRFKAITERAETLESRERQLQAERDRLALELAQAQAEISVMRREQLRANTGWFGRRKLAKAEQGYSTVHAEMPAENS